MRQCVGRMLVWSFVLGGATTFVIAIGIALTPLSRECRSDKGRLAVQGKVATHYFRQTTGRRLDLLSASARGRQLTATETDTALATFGLTRADFENRHWVAGRYAVGWPFLMLECDFRVGFDGQTHGDPLELTPAITLTSTRRWKHQIPLRPVWPALIGNLGVHAATWVIILSSITASRRWNRRRRGRCPACGHSLMPGSVACQECGSPP